jgi:hypothetical protein
VGQACLREAEGAHADSGHKGDDLGTKVAGSVNSYRGGARSGRGGGRAGCWGGPCLSTLNAQHACAPRGAPLRAELVFVRARAARAASRAAARAAAACAAAPPSPGAGFCPTRAVVATGAVVARTILGAVAARTAPRGVPLPRARARRPARVPLRARAHGARVSRAGERRASGSCPGWSGTVWGSCLGALGCERKLPRLPEKLEHPGRKVLACAARQQLLQRLLLPEAGGAVNNSGPDRSAAPTTQGLQRRNGSDGTTAPTDVGIRGLPGLAGLRERWGWYREAPGAGGLVQRDLLAPLEELEPLPAPVTRQIRDRRRLGRRAGLPRRGWGGRGRENSLVVDLVQWEDKVAARVGVARLEARRDTDLRPAEDKKRRAADKRTLMVLQIRGPLWCCR